MLLRYQADGTRAAIADPAFENYDLMIEITDFLATAWENGEPDQEAKEAMIAKLAKEHPEAADMIRQIVESFEAVMIDRTEYRSYNHKDSPADPSRIGFSVDSSALSCNMTACSPGFFWRSGGMSECKC
jgi:hypothetical protein